ncbi:hypothetical protein C5E12_02280 [Rathayibacter rathayi]|nr:hypothetical protein C5E12_02280 [Rathayibacter rathayi]
MERVGAGYFGCVSIFGATLTRDRSTPLSWSQDVASVRFEADMSLDEQDAVIHAVASCFDVSPSMVKNLRGADNEHSGYRAVHPWLVLPNLGRVEVQIRTHRQGMWANAYEALADIAGREIKYGEEPRFSERGPKAAGVRRTGYLEL